MANNTPFREASVSPLFCGNCTTSHSVPITTPGAESTNNLTRARRLGPRWQGQRQLDTQREHPGVLLEIPSPPKSVSEAPSQPHGLTMGDDVRPIRPAPTTAPGVRMPRQTPAAYNSSHRKAMDGATPLRARKRSNRQWSISLGMAVLTVLSVLAAIAWHVGTKRTNSGAVAMGNTPTALATNSPLILPPSSASVKSTVAAKSEAPRDQSEAVDPADHTPQTRAGQEVHHLIPGPPNKNEPARPDSATNRTIAKDTTYGNANAPVDMANEYLRREGVPRGCAKAMLLLNKAAAKGNVRARNRLASLYAIGNCVPRDPVQAYRWLNAALEANPDNQWAQQNRDLILRQMTAKERSQVRNTE
jgi:Sel1 repeat